jgi:LPS sulfotransferase NodH
MFVVIGTQRTGTNILREILNTNTEIAMLGEILSPSTAPAHWDNFLRDQSLKNIGTANAAEYDALLDRYFNFIRYRIRNHWVHNLKSQSSIIGVDIKYNQLRSITPRDWSSDEMPFLLHYFLSRDFTFIHTIRRNVMHCALSALIASQRKLWHNYDGVVIDRTYYINVDECLQYARMIVNDRNTFVRCAKGSKIVASYYHTLLDDIARAAPGGKIPEGPGSLEEIARALDISFQFHYDGRLQKAINVPYSRVVSNFNELISALKSSELSTYASMLGE